MPLGFNYSILTEPVSSTIASLIFLVFLYKKYVNKEAIPIHLAIAYFLLVMGSHLKFLGWFIAPIGYYSNQITYITFTYAIFLIYLHYQAISGKKTLSLLNFFLFSVLQSNTAVTFLLFQEGPIDLFEMSITWYSSLIVFMVTCSFFILKDCVKAHKLMKESATRIELIAILIVIASFFFYLSNEIIFIFLRHYIWVVGQSILILNYLIHKQYVFRLTFPVHDIYVINRGGILVYHRHVSTKNIPELDHSKKTVISGAIKAIMVIVSETLGSEAKLKLFDAEEYKMYFSELKDREGIVAVITSGNNYYLQKSLKKFSSLITEDIIEEFNKPLFSNTNLIKNLDDKLQKSFPYLVLMKNEKEVI